MKKLLTILLLTIPFFIQAEIIDPNKQPDYVLNCAMPTQREDNSKLALSDIASVDFYWDTTQGGNYTNKITETVCQTTFDISSMADGNYYFVVTATDTDGRESKYSAERKLTLLRVITDPKPPTWIIPTVSLLGQ